LLVNGVAINSCLSIALQHYGHTITTMKGLSKGDDLRPVQEAFWDHDAYRCGYCTEKLMTV
jgi:xanthine dehydrogenase YagT iron-sulfur-binding subunit